ncbi:MAG TPA: sensor histidine kinase [Actinobacteria bacterium]|nr:sensor histidine kinase [Actinomycetes bacterium]HEX21595.1 sensor histidine kinase [Actinomycetota bacterium]
MTTGEKIKKQPSFILYLFFGLTTFGASALVFFILFFSGLFKVSVSNQYALVIIGFIYGTSIFSIFILVYNWKIAPERARVLQSHQILTVANETLTYLRQGFNYETIEKVAEIIYKDISADAVAITDNKSIMSFVGIGAQRFKPGAKLSKRSVKSEMEGLETYDIKDKSIYIKEGYNWKGISVPFRIQNRVIGTLEFLYLVPHRFTEKNFIVAKGLGKLLSTQIELSELDKQRNLVLQAEFKALRAQINPHFLFNTLNTIAALCRTEPLKARTLLLRFSDFFRDSLERQSQTTTFEEELRYVNSYLVLEKARFGNKIKIHREIEPAARNVKIPALIIQPLVENAIKHGMSDNSVLNLDLSAKLSENELIISVKDDGVGMKFDDTLLGSSYHEGLGIGLKNVSDRLSALYGSANLISIDSAIGKGTEIILRIPKEEGINVA